MIALLLGMALAAQTGQRLLVLEERAERHALVIGNETYPKGPLKNPVNDAKAVGEALRPLGFRAEVVLNADLRTMRRAVDQFVAAIQPGDVAFFYYAGHGIQIGGENYLIPVDFDAKDEADATYDAYSVSRIHDRMEGSGARLNLIVLDACRNNPFRATRSAGGGLAAMNTGRGTFIAFATAPGRTASDNPTGSNGLYTTHLVKALRQPGLTLDQVFNQVRQGVYESSGKQQLPWIGSSVIGEFYFVPPAGGTRPAGRVETAAPPAQPAVEQQVIRASQPAPAPSQEMERLQEQFTLLAARAGSVRTSLDNLRRSQQSAGLSLRADMAASARLMETYMDEAEGALKRRDAAAATRKMEQAEREVAKLEKFLGQ